MISLLSEDASYFYPVSFIQDTNLSFFNVEDDSKWFKRNCFNQGRYENLFNFKERSIKDSIGWVINQLSNLGMVPDNVFTGYSVNNEDNQLDSRLKERRTQVIAPSGSNSEYLDWVTVSGIWQIIDVLVDSNLENRRQANDQLVLSEGDLLSHMKRICQDPLVEFIGDTYGDKYVYFARQKPFTEEAIKGFLNDNTVIEIDAADVFDFNVSWDTTSYSSYELKPGVDYFGFQGNIALGYIPIIYLTEYAENFGNKRYQVTDSYITSAALLGDSITDDVKRSTYRKGLTNDFKYIIDIHTYLPFTRRGTITINGDRRIKKGTWIKFLPTDEAYYVTDVTNMMSNDISSIERTTTLQVERGMFTRYIYEKEFNYFNIVDTNLIRQILLDETIEGDDNIDVKVKRQREITKASFQVNKPVFNFFLNRQQVLNPTIR
jgi:hypothetical protein